MSKWLSKVFAFLINRQKSDSTRPTNHQGQFDKIRYLALDSAAGCLACIGVKQSKKEQSANKKNQKS